jgi:hypothetical protein
MRRSFKMATIERAATPLARRKDVLFAAISYGLARLLGSNFEVDGFNLDKYSLTTAKNHIGIHWILLNRGIDG